jgi:GntR family transcriptional regulator, galactonate operon transcriptional repressor
MIKLTLSRGSLLKLSGQAHDPEHANQAAFDSARRHVAGSISPGKIESRGLVDGVVHRIGGNIVSGQLKPRHTLPNESALCEQLGVSRSVLREAVRVLVSKGLLERKSRLGTRVCLPEAWSLLDSEVLDWLSCAEPRDRFIRELFGLRRLVEPGIAALAAESMSAVDLGELEACHRDMISAGNDVDRFFEPDFRFHRIILRSVNNSLVHALGSTIAQALEINLRLSLAAPLGQQRSVPQHGAILDAIRQRNPEAAREATIHLINEAEKDVWQALAESRKPDDRAQLRHQGSAQKNAAISELLHGRRATWT